MADRNINIADAKAHLSELVERAAAGESVVLTRRGRPVARKAFRTAARFTDQAGIGLRAGDALHLATASAHGATLVTLDQKLLQAAPAVAVDTLAP